MFINGIIVFLILDLVVWVIAFKYYKAFALANLVIALFNLIIWTILVIVKLMIVSSML